MVNKELLIIEPLSDLLLPEKIYKDIYVKKSKEEKLNFPTEIKKRKTKMIASLEELLGGKLNHYRKLSLPEIEEKVITMEGVLTSERQPIKTTENFIIKTWKEEKSSEKVNLYLWLLEKIYPDDFNYLLIVDEKNRNKLFLLRNQDTLKKNYR